MDRFYQPILSADLMDRLVKRLIHYTHTHLRYSMKIKRLIRTTHVSNIGVASLAKIKKRL